MNDKLRIAALESQVLEMETEIERLREAIGLKISIPICFGLTKSQGVILSVLMKKDIAPKESLWLAIYGSKVEEDEAEIKIIDVWVCKMRKTLKEFDIEIHTAWGQGYYIKPEDKKKVAELARIVGQDVRH